MKTVFTTGEAAEICKVSQQTIIRCFDSGRLKGFRVPGSRFRRIPREALVAFMKDNNIPPDALDNGKLKILVVDDDPEIVELFVDVLERDGRFDFSFSGLKTAVLRHVRQRQADLARVRHAGANRRRERGKRGAAAWPHPRDI